MQPFLTLCNELQRLSLRDVVHLWHTLRLLFAYWHWLADVRTCQDVCFQSGGHRESAPRRLGRRRRVAAVVPRARESAAAPSRLRARRTAACGRTAGGTSLC